MAQVDYDAPVLPNAVQEIVATLSAQPEVTAIALGGSRCTGFADAESDYDIYVFVESEIPLSIPSNLRSVSIPRPRSTTPGGVRVTNGKITPQAPLSISSTGRHSRSPGSCAKSSKSTGLRLDTQHRSGSRSPTRLPSSIATDGSRRCRVW